MSYDNSHVVIKHLWCYSGSLVTFSSKYYLSTILSLLHQQTLLKAPFNHSTLHFTSTMEAIFLWYPIVLGTFCVPSIIYLVMCQYYDMAFFQCRFYAFCFFDTQYIYMKTNIMSMGLSHLLHLQPITPTAYSQPYLKHY